eukprot:2416328-Amphidinium_carterae.4
MATSIVELQDTVLNGCLNSFAYVAHKTFAQLKEQPWCSGHGDVEQNLKDFISGKLEPTCPWSQHVFELGSTGLISERKLLDAVSAVHVEKMHASITKGRKHHLATGGNWPKKAGTLRGFHFNSLRVDEQATFRAAATGARSAAERAQASQASARRCYHYPAFIGRCST